MPTWASGVCDAGGVSLRYLRTGGAKPPLVMLHGLAASGACWSPVARALEDAFDVVMLDARGHGQSSAPPYGYRYEDHADDVVALLRNLGLASPVLLGHSMGGMTAAVVASRLGNGIRAVVLADPTFLSPQRQREVRDSDVADRHRRLLGSSRNELISDARRRHPNRSAEIAELLADARLQTQLAAFDVLTPPNPDYRALMAAISTPVLLVIGDDAPAVSLAAAKELEALNPHVRGVQIQDAGHGIPYDQPRRLAAAARSFLGSLDAARRKPGDAA